ncbi:energy-coupling factor ABC transporter permease [Clostridium formicaceticum]|uniref:Cobalt transport protein CbiM n=1 Tax=Clostridium formicaceticum TaxID=1497 RepID=A0AAC9RIN8_9CLOT|nr:energy-coupling factor ABC transporter permease [Clostridium formicaceticum]AOY76129.1 cobalamin biosynthesis protein CbiM [Clostridium formicaceticum]ARE86497.1 Cobalt transport protein CbiM [Clostridium formicaceticum]
MKKENVFSAMTLAGLFTLIPTPVFAMHIMEGFLPVKWTVIWWLVSLPFLVLSYKKMKEVLNERSDGKMMLALCGAFIFVLSALKLPSVTGSSSHPTGVGLGAILFGPYAMVLLSFVVLVFQSLLLAHGGITTLGANTFSMGIVGPIVAYGSYKLLKMMKAPVWLAVMVAAALGNLATYIVTALQLAIVYQDPVGGFSAALMKFMGIFAVTQIPLAITEGLLTVAILNLVWKYNKEGLQELDFMRGEI